MSDQEKDKEKIAAAVTTPAPEATSAPVPGGAVKTASDEEASQYFYGEALVGFDQRGWAQAQPGFLQRPEGRMPCVLCSGA